MEFNYTITVTPQMVESKYWKAYTQDDPYGKPSGKIKCPEVGQNIDVDIYVEYELIEEVIYEENNLYVYIDVNSISKQEKQDIIDFHSELVYNHFCV